MKKIILLFLLSVSTVLTAQTVYKVDINEASRNNMDEVLETGFTPWPIGKDKSAPESLTVGDATFTIRAEGMFRGGWNKAFVQAQENKDRNGRLTGDGCNLEPNACGSFELVIKGLSAGEHTIQTYHNSWDNKDQFAVYPITVRLNGTVVHQSVALTQQEPSAQNATVLLTTFTVSGPDDEAVLTFTTYEDDVPNTEGKTKMFYSPLLNGFMIDVANATLQAKLPYPANHDLHADGDNGIITLSWSPANADVTSHKLYIGTDSTAVGQADETSELFMGTKSAGDTTYVLNDVYSLNTYYWRVDEVAADGTVTNGEVWQFRPRHLAFPGAEGYGRYAIGGRGGVVYHVTSLSGGKEPGTLLYGLVEMDEPRYIVFDVSGIIELDFSSHFTKPYAYIAGQTAPGKGICIKASNINIGSDVICRHMRFKRGYGDTGNALGMTGADHSIVDHTTAAWGTDETFSSRGAKNITFQYSMIAEALGIADHKNYGEGTNHGFAATIGGDYGTFSHNLLVNCAGRNWSMGGGLDGNGNAAGELDMFNNVCYNWWKRTTDGGAKWMQFVNNYYKMGPDTKRTELFTAQNEGGGERTQFAYVSGNIRENKDHTLTQDALNVTYNATGPEPEKTWVSSPFFESQATIHSAGDAMKIVTTNAGATMPCRDDQHVRVVRETIDGTYTYVGSRSGIKGEIDHEDDQGGWEEYPEEHRADDFDTDQDGMPDWWEQCTGSNPVVANQNDDPDGDGWTLLEDYLEFMAHPYIVIEPNGQGTIDLREHFAGFFGQNGNSVTPTFTCDTQTDNGVSIDINGTSMTVTAAGFTSPTILSYPITVNDGETTFTLRFGVAVTKGTTGIVSLRNPEYNIQQDAYDLTGRKVKSVNDKSERGIYIVGGKKVVVN